jgi:hypothetical protein
VAISDVRFKTSTFLARVPPGVVVFLSSTVWIAALVRSNFFADDFYFLASFSGFSNLFDVHLDEGQFAVNIFWTLGTTAFGYGSAVPYLLLNSSILFGGLGMWLVAGKRRWPATCGWWVAGLLVANAAWMTIALWSANSTHSVALFALGGAMLSHERVLRAGGLQAARSWSLLGAAAWLLVVASDPLYIGVAPIIIYCCLIQRPHLLRSAGSRWLTNAVLLCSVLLPSLYFALIGYPQKSAVAAYSGSSLRFIATDLRLYLDQMAPSTIIKAVYLSLAIVTGIAVAGALIRRDFFPVACSLSAALMIGILLTESQQIYPNYTVIPLLLVLSACVAGCTTVARSNRLRVPSRSFCGAATVLGAISLAILFYAGSGVRAYFTATPYGDQRGLALFRYQVASMIPPGTPLCVVLELTRADGVEFRAWMGQEYGFLLFPINAGSVYFADSQGQCASSGTATIKVTEDANGEFRALLGSAP